MPQIPRFRRDQDPRRPPNQPDDASTQERSGTQPDDVDELEAFEDLTGEVAREGDADGNDNQPRTGDRASRRELDERESFEDLTGEVTREGDDEPGRTS